MTRKEAIKDLEVIKDFFVENSGAIPLSIEYAIKALVEQELIFDKIKAEIEEIHLIGYATVDGKREIARRAVMQIIDKYKGESEGV